jgi:hypothetical protein
MTCHIYAVGKKEAVLKANPSFDFYEFNCEAQFGGMALCTNEGIRFIVNTKEPYTGAIYAAEKFSTCSQVVENAKQIAMTFPPPTISSNCGTTIKDGKLEALIVLSLDGVIPHQVTTGKFFCLLKNQIIFYRMGPLLSRILRCRFTCFKTFELNCKFNFLLHISSKFLQRQRRDSKLTFWFVGQHG